jgi:hypothetical protein
LAGFLIILVGMVLWGRTGLEICWDGIEVDEPRLQELCGISREEYFSPDFDPERCPEAEQAVYLVGDCDTNWASVILYTGWAGGAYLLASGIGYAVWGLAKRARQE